MKNILKKALAVVSALALVATGVAVSPASAEAAESWGTAYIGICSTESYAISSWQGSHDGWLIDSDVVTVWTYSGTEITGYDSYEVTLTVPAFYSWSSDLVCDCLMVDICDNTLGIESDEDIEAYPLNLSNVTVTLNGTAVTITEDNVDFFFSDGKYIRIAIMNPWRSSGSDALSSLTINSGDVITIGFTLSGAATEEEDDGTTDDGDTDDGDTDDDDTTTTTTTTTDSTTTDSTNTDSTSTDSTSASSTTDSTSTDSTSTSSTTDSTTTTDTTSTSSSTSDSNSTSATTGEASTFVIVMVCVVAIAGVAFSMKKAR